MVLIIIVPRPLQGEAPQRDVPGLPDFREVPGQCQGGASVMMRAGQSYINVRHMETIAMGQETRAPRVMAAATPALQLRLLTPHPAAQRRPDRRQWMAASSRARYMYTGKSTKRHDTQASISSLCPCRFTKGVLVFGNVFLAH
ncbi:hypothetical protein VOLCADRAFT_95067 [Volvox carteri f. nagariensis]|uniref:Uncharacterized protein n=1 Tax=Volvox carteri f. nagariensis TaxID=3068 RepID=D8U6I1_VOLCA|nr:uncharacterized protein VOLCADRAFT_95067 [Volvox carteri f. nagariensis]EFJ44717.1 hypothetical protein VOLCADRAFT_95067 [Volvox carteri f. nagariensis]|eukprot:XP_002954293.1 hypothetical protein VOLCADRAFT_95067 [Volvox carteri f. nagariensis]